MVENFLSSLIVYGKDSINGDYIGTDNILEAQYKNNSKFKRVIWMIVRILREFSVCPSFMERTYLEPELRDFLLRKLTGLLRDVDHSSGKMLWIECVSFYNELCHGDKDFEVVKLECEIIKSKLKEIERLLGTHSATQMVEKTTNYLFVKRKFVECGDFLEGFFKVCKKKDKNKQGKLNRLLDACNQARKMDSSSLMVQEESTAALTGDDVEVYTENLIINEINISQKEMDTKMANFEKIDLNDQIDTADKYILSYLKKSSKLSM